MSGTIKIVGLGSGNENSLSLGVYRLLKESKNIYFRTKVHPVVEFLDDEILQYETFDYLYDTLSEYDLVYKKIALFLIDRAKEGKNPVYGVPGHPMVAEKSVKYLLEIGKQENINVEVIGGESFLDTFFSSLNIDPIEGFVFLNAETITINDLNPTKNVLIGQVYNNWVASDLKLTLMEMYPDEMPIYLVSNLGINEKEIIKEIKLYELDHNSDDFHHLSSVFIPKTDDERIRERQFSRLTEIVQILRGPNGCPWDKAQTHHTIRKNLIEETYEVLETIDELDYEHLNEELGDLLLQVMLHAQIADDDGFFNINDVIRGLNQKLIRRHPHVFGNESAEEAEDALLHWNTMKDKEKLEKDFLTEQSALDGIPKDLPAILKAYKLQKKAAKVKFDWSNIEDVYAKIEEEFLEVKAAKKADQPEEIGDLLFAVVNLARFLEIDPEDALANTNLKFIRRFKYIEKRLKEEKIPLADATLEIMDTYWNEAKGKKL